MKEAVSGGSDVATTGVTKVGGSTQFTSLAVPDTFKPSAPSAVAPSTAPTAFVGPIPATATRTDTGYTTASGTAVSPTAKTSVAAAAPAINTSKQFSGVSNNATSTATTFSPATNLSGKVDTTPSSINKKALAGDAAELAFGAKSIPAGARALGAAITGKNAQGKSVNRLSSAAAGLGNIGLGAINAISTASLIVPGGGEVAKAADVALNAGIKGSKAIATHATGKVASGIAAGIVAASPVTHAAEAGKAATSITQSIEAGKAAKAVGTFVPKAAKASTENALAKSVPNVVKPSIASGVKAGTGIKVAKTITAVDAVAKVGTALNNKDTKDNTDNAPTVPKAATTYQTPYKTNDSRSNQFNAEVNKTTVKDGVIKDSTSNEIVKDVSKDTIKKDNKDTQNNKDTKDTQDIFNVRDVKPDVKPFQNVSDSGGGREPGPEGTRPPKKEEKSKPRRIPRIKLKNDGRQWRPSSIV